MNAGFVSLKPGKAKLWEIETMTAPVAPSASKPPWAIKQAAQEGWPA